MPGPLVRSSGGAGLPGGALSGPLRNLSQPRYNKTSVGRPPKPQNKNRPAPKPQANHPPTGHATPTQPTDPLAPLSPQQIRQQATNTITKSYAPEFTDLGQQGSQAKNLYATQTADDKYFRDWLASKSQELQGRIDTVNGKLADVLSGIRTNQANALGALPGALQGQVQGTGVAPGQLQQGLANETAGTIANANSAVDNANAQNISNVQTANAGLFDMSAINQTQMSALQGKQLDTLNKSLHDIANERTKLLVGRTGDIAKEIARLNGIEISKAQFRANQANLQAATGIKAAAVKVQAQNAATSAKNADTTRLKAQEDARHNSVMEGIARNKSLTDAQKAAAALRETTRHDKATEGINQQNADTNAKNATTRANAPGAPGKPPKPASPERQAAIRKQINELRSALIWDINTFHKNDPNALTQAWHDLKNGNYNAARGTKTVTDPNTGKVTKVPGARVPVAVDDGIVNAAVNTLTQYGAQGLTPGDIAWLEQQGLTNVEGYYPVKGTSAGREGVAGFTG